MIRLPLKFEHKVLDPLGIVWHDSMTTGIGWYKDDEGIINNYDILGRGLEKILQVEDIFVLVDKHNFIGEVVEKIEEIYG